MKTIPAYKILHALDWAEMAQRHMARLGQESDTSYEAVSRAVRELRSILVELDIEIDTDQKEAA
jgi:hypothetical protein